MYSLRKWFYRPKRTDTSLFAQFFFADDELNKVTLELDSFDGRKDPERCTLLVNQLRACQDKVLSICNHMLDEVVGEDRAPRDFRAKFPDDVLQENLAGQLWFGAECLAAGSCIMNREMESAGMRPLAKAVTKSLENVRALLREQCLKSPQEFTEKLCESLKIFDRLFAEFELRYVSAMVTVKSAKEYALIQNVIALFSETVQRALRLGLLSQEQLDLYDPALMFTIPRLAIVAGLVIYPDGPLRLDQDIADISELFRPFKNLLCKIRELLWTLSKAELYALEKALCSVDEPINTVASDVPSAPDAYPMPDIDAFVAEFYSKNPGCRRSVSRSACRETEARLRQFHPGSRSHRRRRGQGGSGSGSNGHRRLARSGATAEEAATAGAPAEQRRGSATEPAARGRVGRVPIIACDYGSRLDQRRDVERQVASIVDDLVGLAVSEAERRAQSAEEPEPPAAPAPAPGHSGTGRHRKKKLTRAPCGSAGGLLYQHNHCSPGGAPAEGSSHQSSQSGSDSSDDERPTRSGDREIALAIQAAEIATRSRSRARFKDSQDLIHRLFVCISGVADQLQTNFASDLRNILKVVFQINATPEEDSSGELSPSCGSVDSAEEALGSPAAVIDVVDVGGPAPAPAPAPRSPAILQPPISPAPRRSPSRPVPHILGIPGPYSAASDMPTRIERPPPPPPPARPPPKIQVQAADEPAPGKLGGSLPRPSSLPLQPVKYVNKSQRGAALYSPETPRPRKAIQQTHMNGKCYTYIGHKSSTKLYFCSLFQPQPNYVEQKCGGHQVSMYSQWKHSEPPADGVPVTRALSTLRLSVNRGSFGRLSFASPELGPTEPRLAATGLRQPRLSTGRRAEKTESGGQRRSAAGCTCSRVAGGASLPCPSCSDRTDPAACSDRRDRYPSSSSSAGAGPVHSRLLGADLSIRTARNGRPPSWGSSWDSAGDERDREASRSPRHRRLSSASGSAEDLAAAETLVTFRGSAGAGHEEQDGPIDLSVGSGRQAAAVPRRSAADVLRPLAEADQLGIMYAVLGRLDVSREERPAPLRLPPTAAELPAKQRRVSAEPAAPVPPSVTVTALAAGVAAVVRTLPQVKEEAMSPPLPPPPQPPQPAAESSRLPVVVEEMPDEKPPPPPPPPPPPAPRAISPAGTDDAGSDVDIEIDVVSPGDESSEPARAAPADGSAPPAGGMQAILKDIFNQVRHERASAGFAPSRPEAAAASGTTEPAGSAPSLMHPNVTAGQPGLALTRPTQRVEPAEPAQHSDSSFFNRNSDRLVCTVCNKRDFVNRNQLSAHTKTHQMDQRRFRCDVCEVSFRSEQQLNKHRKSNDHLQKANIHRQFGKPQGDRRIYECLFCMRGFHNIGTLHKHFRCKTHIMGLENAGWLPCGTYAELEALGVPGRTDGADSINVEGTWPNYCHLQELSLTLLQRDRHAEMADWRRKFDDIRRGRPPRSYPFEIDPKLRGNADPSRPRPQFPADFFRAPPANGTNESTNAAQRLTYRSASAAGGGGGGGLCAPLKQEQADEEPTEPLRLNGQSY